MNGAMPRCFDLFAEGGARFAGLNRAGHWQKWRGRGEKSPARSRDQLI